ncbi:MAG: hypothetical protein HQ546_02910 [Planctomycetes bacterium]|nr:hypothetical protein [Planctomycetota bacterium]
MTRLGGIIAGPIRRLAPDIYTVLLLVGILFLLVGCIVVCWDLMHNYGLSVGQLFKGVGIPR